MRHAVFASTLVLGPEALQRSPALVSPNPAIEESRKFVEGMAAWSLPERFGARDYVAEWHRAQARAVILRAPETSSTVLQNG